MSNPSRAKGTRYENELRESLRPIFPNIERAPLMGVNDAGDFLNVPIPIEAKSTKVPKFFEWVRRLRAVTFKKKVFDLDRAQWDAPSGTCRWALFYCPDRRKADNPGELAVLDASFARELLECYYRDCQG